MPTLQPHHIVNLQPLIFAFEGQIGKSRDTDVLEGEGDTELFVEFIHDGRKNGLPKQFNKHHYLTPEEIILYKIDKGMNYPLKCYLWVIDAESVKIIWEMTTNLRRKNSNPDKPYVCHTNITGKEGKAYIGGEMYFCSNGNVYVNFSSGRFGRNATEKQKEMTIQYLSECGYSNIISVEYEL